MAGLFTSAQRACDALVNDLAHLRQEVASDTACLRRDVAQIKTEISDEMTDIKRDMRADMENIIQRISLSKSTTHPPSAQADSETAVIKEAPLRYQESSSRSMLCGTPPPNNSRFQSAPIHSENRYKNRGYREHMSQPQQTEQQPQNSSIIGNQQRNSPRKTDRPIRGAGRPNSHDQYTSSDTEISEHASE